MRPTRSLLTLVKPGRGGFAQRSARRMRPGALVPGHRDRQAHALRRAEPPRRGFTRFGWYASGERHELLGSQRPMVIGRWNPVAEMRSRCPQHNIKLRRQLADLRFL